MPAFETKKIAKIVVPHLPIFHLQLKGAVKLVYHIFCLKYHIFEGQEPIIIDVRMFLKHPELIYQMFTMEQKSLDSPIINMERKKGSGRKKGIETMNHLFNMHNRILRIIHDTRRASN